MTVAANSSGRATAEERRALLASRLQQVASARSASYPLSFAQQRLWFLDQLEPESPLYNLATAVKVTGKLDISALQQSLNSLVARHDILRARVVCNEGTAAQIIDSKREVAANLFDLSKLPEEERSSRIEGLIRAEVDRPFDLEKGMLLRATLVRLSSDEHLMLLVMHHIISDEWSVKILFRELAEFYEAYRQDRAPKIGALPLQYVDFAVWQRNWILSDAARPQINYWKRQLHASPPALELPTDLPRTPRRTHEGATYARLLGRELADTTKHFASQEGASLFMVLFAAFKALLYRYTGQQDVIVGTPVAGRTRMEIEGLVGIFVNTLAVRTSFSSETTFRELVRSIRETTLDAFAHQDLPFDRLVEELRPERLVNHVPFFNILFALQQDRLDEIWMDGVRMQFVDVPANTAKFELTLTIQDTRNGLVARCEYNKELFAAESITRFLHHFEVLLRGGLAVPDKKVCQLPLLTQEERQQILLDWNTTASPYPRDKCIQELFERQVDETPDAVVLSFKGSSLTYRELNRRANQLARRLQRCGVGPGVLVGISLERSFDLIVSMLAILKAGGAYVPLDGTYPRDRLQFMLHDASFPVLITDKSFRGLDLQTEPRIVLLLDDEQQELGAEGTENLTCETKSGDLAYVMYTSGSTGAPKGVCVPHRAVVRLVKNTNYLEFASDEVFLQSAPVCFDASTLEIWGCLVNGGRLVVMPPQMPSLDELGQTIVREKVTTLWLTSGLFQQMIDHQLEQLQGVRNLLAGGDVLSVAHVLRALRHLERCKLINGYGPTENTTFSCCYLIPQNWAGDRSVPIGRPISNSTVFVLDLRGQPVPIGVPGELYVGGDGLACGYHLRPELSAEKFVPNPFSKDGQSSVLYRTGDLVRWRADGNLEFLGRSDEQIKLRGFRIELGEIEAVLGSHPDVRDCVARIWGNGAAEKQLAAYVVAQGRNPCILSDWRRFLKERLPEHMLPSVLIPLESMPLSPNGKVDRSALPEPSHERPELEKKYLAPQNRVEVELARIWERVLGVSPIGIKDNFFDLGGHSLMALRLIAQIENQLGKKLRVGSVFQAPTIDQMGELVSPEVKQMPRAKASSLVEIQPKGSKPALFLVHGAGGGMFWGYGNLARHLGQDQPVYGFKSRGLDGADELKSLEEMATKYLADMRALQPKGPYYLGGYCFGGIVAYEMARQLYAEGEIVQLLILMNCSPPNASYSRVRVTPIWLLRFVQNLLYWANYFRQWTPSQRRGFFRWKFALLKKRFGAKVSISGDKRNPDVEKLVDLSCFSDEERKLWEVHIRAQLNFHPKSYAGRITLFRSPGHPIWCSFDPEYGWRDFAGNGVDAIVVPGAHEKILEEPCVRVLAIKLHVLLARSRGAEPYIQSPEWQQPEPETPQPDSGAATVTVEERALLEKWNSTEREYGRGKRLEELFEEQVEARPQSEALVCGSRRLSYRELYVRSKSLAQRLMGMGVGQEKLVGICLERTWEMVAGMMGTLQAGGAYVALDPAYPAERLGFMMADSGVGVVLTQRRLLGSLPASQAQVLCVEDVDWESFKGGPAGARAGDSKALAYVIYTSGSTGKPKGVALEHRSAVALVSWAREVYGAQELDGVLAATSICFDLSVFELFVPLSCGGKVVMAANGLALAGLEEAGEVRLINTVPSVMRELLRLKAVPRGVKVVNLAGEPLSQELVEQIYRETGVEKVYDLYGPTETTTYSTWKLRKVGEKASIGKPLDNEQVYVLDEGRQLVPIGVAGEIYIGGEGLARGYLGREELTGERFVDNPFRRGERMYRTGDRGRWMGDGELEYLGRLDQQVKVRGYRVELGEVESVLAEHRQVAEAVVVAREEASGDKRLVAYVVPKGRAPANLESLQKWSKDKLPGYMIPSAFVFLEKLPLTPNGKIDRKALPAPEPEPEGQRDGTVPPRTPEERQVASIWSEILEVKQVGAMDNFFELGGHSLSAIRVISRMREVFRVDIALDAFFHEPTVAAVAKGLAEGRWARKELLALQPCGSVARVEAPASFVQRRLWFLDQLEPGSSAYNVPMALRVEGELRISVLEQALNVLVSRHEVLRTRFRFDNGNLIQVIAPTCQIKIKTFDLRTHEPSERQVAKLVDLEAQHPFDLSVGPLIRVSVIRLSRREHVVLLVMHHAISDGWSLDLFFREVGLVYDGLTDHGLKAGLGAPSFQYADFVEWQKSHVQGPVLNKELVYWKEKLAGAPSRIELPLDHGDPEEAGSRAAECGVLIQSRVAEAVKAMSQREATTPFVVLMSALAVALRQWTGQQDLVIGTVAAGRTRREFEDVMGCFMNFLPIRAEVAGTETAQEIVAKVRTTLLEAQMHQDCPFDKVVEAINPERRLNQNPIYNVALVMQHYPAELFKTRTLRSKSLPVHLEAALLDLRFEAELTTEGLYFKCEYKPNLFDRTSIERFLASFSEILQKLLDKPASALSEVAATAGVAQTKELHKRNQKLEFTIAATFTAEPLEEPLRYALQQSGLSAGIQFAPYNQVFQQLLSTSSHFSRKVRGLNVVLVRLEDWIGHGSKQAGAGEGALEDRPSEPLTFEGKELQRTADEFVLAVKSAAGRSSKPFLICFCPSNSSLFDPKGVQFLSSLEQKLITELAEMPGVYLLTTGELLRWYPVPDVFDPVANELGHVPFTPRFFTALGTAIVRKFHALNRPRYKVIVLDCDHTLWSGVCGEDGPQGIELSPPRQALQSFMQRQLDEGMLLCLCSKNNEQDVRDVFAQRPDMPLRMEHFAASRINWRPKSENLKSLAQELKLGLDSFILVDDNPLECAEVSANCPGVLTLQLPDDPERIPRFLNNCWAFDCLRVTSEDRKRPETYRQNQQREKLRAEALTLGDFLSRLELQIQIEPAIDAQHSRMLQLTQRTNQFNSTTIRYTESDLKQVLLSHEALGVSVSDRFGDYGLVGVIIFKLEGGSLDVNGFLLSCRVLGRGVEHQMLAHLGSLAKAQGLSWVDVHFTPTARNTPTLDFLESVGGQFKQPFNGGYLFRFPSDFAAEVKFNPSPSENQNVERPSATAEQSLRVQGLGREAGSKSSPGHGLPEDASRSIRIAVQSTDEAQRAVGVRCLALEENEILQIHRTIQAQPGSRPKRSSGAGTARGAMERTLCELWQRLLRVERVGTQDNFFDLGGYSLMAVQLFSEIEKITKRKFPLVTIFQAPTIEQLARVLSRDQTEGKASLLVPLQPRGDKPPLFLVHGAGGDVLWGYANLAACLPSDQPLYGLKSRGQLGLEEPASIEEMAKCYLEEIRAFQAEGPYYLGGYCFGGNVAYEMARQLESQGQSVALLALLDSAPANAGYETMPWWHPSFPFRFLRNIYFWLEDFEGLECQQRLRFIARKTRIFGRKLWRRLRDEQAPVDVEEVIDFRQVPTRELRLWELHLRALTEHHERSYGGTAVLFRTQGQPIFCSLAEDFCWGRLVRQGITVRRIPGSHENIFIEPNVHALARELQACLSSAEPLRDF